MSSMVAKETTMQMRPRLGLIKTRVNYFHTSVPTAYSQPFAVVMVAVEQFSRANSERL